MKTNIKYKTNHVYTLMRNKTSIANVKARIHASSFYAQRLEGFVKRGTYAQAKCPFHPDNNPSFSVNTETGYARCFGCGWHGDIIDFVSKFYSVSLFEALNLLKQEI